MNGGDQEDDQRAIPEERPNAFGFAAAFGLVGAAGDSVIDLGRPDG
jgi:hypothetical protein